ncbi:Cholecystokinin receptor [Holothuria leucospilota]|uniref:Cholecystokinin receptor n=1 Tax=Holothuria leucospilota TaxID=206669 RepID=A0A9Q1HAG7_HOLLE|nr:Cholecystokinin receptor [Holothuria leucospilota]
MVTSCDTREVWYFNYTSENPGYHSGKTSVALEALSLIAIIVVSVIANTLAILAIWRSNHRRNIHLIFILNLFVTDLLTSSITMVFSLYDVFHPGYMKCFQYLCKIQNFLALFLGLSNVSAICLIAIHRFLGVVMSSRITIRKNHAYVMLVVAWLIPFIISVFPVSGLVSSSVYMAGVHSCSPDWKETCSFFIIMMIVIYGVALPTMIVCYTLIIREIRKSETRLRKTRQRALETETSRNDEIFGSPNETLPSNDNPTEVTTVSAQVDMATKERDKARTKPDVPAPCKREDTRSRINMSVDKRVAIASGLIISVNFVCWTPFFIVHTTCVWDLVPSHGLGIFVKWLLFFNCALDPLLYVALNKRLRKSLWRRNTLKRGPNRENN